MADKYAVIQYRTNGNHIIYGIGDTKQDAFDDAQNWAEEDRTLCWADEYSVLSEEEQGNYDAVFASGDNYTKHDGMFLLVRCSEGLAEAVAQKGGDIPFELECGCAYLPQEIEGW